MARDGVCLVFGAIDLNLNGLGAWRRLSAYLASKRGAAGPVVANPQ